MLDRVENLKSQVEAAALSTKEEAEAFRLHYLSKKGVITELFKAFREVPAQEKKAFGAALNTLKSLAEGKHKEAIESLDHAESAGANGDLTRPGTPYELGAIHPINAIQIGRLEHTRRVSRSVPWKPRNPLFVLFHQAECFAMKPSAPAATVYFIKLKGFMLTKG